MTTDKTAFFSKTVIVSYSLVVLLIGFAAYTIYTKRADFNFLGSASLLDLSAAALLTSAGILVGIFQLKPFFENYGVTLGIWELGSLTTLSTLGNLLLPMRGGTGALAFYLNKLKGMKFSEFALTYAGTGVLMALVNAGLALLALLILYLEKSFFDPLLSSVITILFVTCLVLSLWPPRIISKQSGILAAIGQTLEAWHSLTCNRGLLLRATIAFTAVPVLLGGAFYFIYRAVGYPLPLSAVMVTYCLANFANFIPITPGSLGFFDFFTIKIPLLFEMDLARSIAATVIFRSLFLSASLVFGIPALVYLTRITRKQGEKTV